MSRMSRMSILLFLAVFWVMPLAFAQEKKAEKEIEMPEVVVVGEDASKVHGSATVVTKEVMEESHPASTNEALRKLPGVVVKDEEGFGMRPNIGVRGLSPTRSTKVTLLEDGIPLSYAPYGDNASYYHPPIDRFDRIELLKGAEQVLFGPQTIGGTLNYIGATPPQEFGGLVSGALGTRNFSKGRIRFGGHGMLLDYMRKEGDGARENIHSKVQDVNFRVVHQLGDRNAITFRSSYFDEDSRASYSGLTEAEFANFGPRYNPLKNDVMNARRQGYSVTHAISRGDLTVTTNLYYTYFARDWWRQSDNSDDTLGHDSSKGSPEGIALKNKRHAGERVDYDTIQANRGKLRKYSVRGIEPRLKFAYASGSVRNELETGVKLHMEKHARLQVNGGSPTARGGVNYEDNLRTADATSVFLVNKSTVGAWSIMPGVRLEQIKTERTHRPVKEDIIDKTTKLATGSRTTSLVTGSQSLTEVLPSLGVNWNPSETFTVFSGIHRGFAPPRNEDISETSTSTEVGAEDSTNFELGLRARPTEYSSIQAVYFRNDFKRLIAVGSVAGGSLPVSQGEALFQGIELSGDYKMDEVGPYFRGGYTWLPTSEQSTPYVDVVKGTPVSTSVAGNRQPYSPEHMLNVSLGYERGGFDSHIESVYVGKQFSGFSNTTVPNLNGQEGLIPGHLVWNLAINYAIQPSDATKRSSTSLFMAVKNLADKVYIVDRSRGIMTGSPRLIEGGVKYIF